MSNDKENIKKEKKNKKLLNLKKTYKFIGFILIFFFLILFVLYAPRNLAKFEKNKPNKEITKTETSDCHNCFILGPNMNFFHNGPAVLLDNGNILVNNSLITQNIGLNIPRYNHQAIQINNGNIIIIGGYKENNGIRIPLKTIEIYYKYLVV